MAVALAFVMFASCARPDPSSLSYLDKEIVISGVEDEDFTVTVRELTELESVRKKAEAMRANGDIVKTTAVGPTIDTFLAKYGKDKAGFSSVRFSASDGYSIAVPKEVLDSREIVLSYMDGAEPYPKEVAPLRAVVIGERAMYWARMVNKIEFETGTSGSLTNKVVFLETALPGLKSEYSEEEGGDIVSTIDLLSKYGGMTEGGKVFMAAYDGLKKNETIENFLKGYIKYTGDNIPQFCSPDLPEGMNLNGVAAIRTGTTIYVSLQRGSEIWEAREGAGKTGIGFSDVVKDQGFDRNGVFQMTDAAGGVTLYSEHDIVKGVFAKDGATWAFYAEGKDPASDVISVEAVNPGAGQ
ncbi:MAG: hypothetical protein LBJ91_00355 [Clostridiales Family XIII bacterium]|nr:hypothetical protein [Clostridiales Family XIII bacterium]